MKNKEQHKANRIMNRMDRIDERFLNKIAKGKKGTDMDIEKHENRLERLAKRGDIDLTFNSPLGFRMPHSPLNQNDSIAASKAWKIDTENYRKRKFRGNNPKLGPITPEENERERIGEQSTKYYDIKEQRLKLIPTDDAERQDQEFKSKLKKWQLSPLNQNEKEVSDKTKRRLAKKINEVKDNTPQGERKFQKRLRKYEKATGSKDWWAHTKEK